MKLNSEAGKCLLWIEEGRKGHIMLRCVLKGCTETLCCTHTQWSHPSYHHLALGTQHLLLLPEGSSANREMCSCLLTLCSTTAELQIPTAPGLHLQVCGMGFARQPHCSPTFTWSGQVTLVCLFLQIWQVSCLLYITLKAQQSTSNKYLPLPIRTSTWHRKKKVNFR